MAGLSLDENKKTTQLNVSIGLCLYRTHAAQLSADIVGSVQQPAFGNDGIISVGHQTIFVFVFSPKTLRRKVTVVRLRTNALQGALCEHANNAFVSICPCLTDGEMNERLRFSTCYIEFSAADCLGAVCSEHVIQVTLYPNVEYTPSAPNEVVTLIGAIDDFGRGLWRQEIVDVQVNRQW